MAWRRLDAAGPLRVCNAWSMAAASKTRRHRLNAKAPVKCESTGGRIGKWGKTRPATGAAGGHPHARLITRTLNEVTTKLRTKDGCCLQ
ncbi:hypothetical protein GCM10010052_08750 [Paenarthrobacter histidinolovorans]|nr:hypothetical protein GCM10010052_08750 [Paenarthrobacter histidinolovorans]